MRFIIFLIPLFIYIDSSIAQCKKKYLAKEIVGYYPAWQYYDRDKLANPENINYKRYTSLIYAFFKPMGNGNIVGGDRFADESILKGEINWSISTNTKHYHFKTTSLPYQAHLKKTKVLISIGGWTYSRNFSNVAKHQKSRNRFASQCIKLINEYNIDGVDIDWEFPGYSAQGGGPEDKDNFIKLLTEIRTSFDSLQQKTNKKYYLSVALKSDYPHNQYLDWQGISKNCDMVNLMCYDLFGAWVKKTTHKAALFKHPDPNFINKPHNADSLFQIMVEGGVPSEKINLGCAFDGRTTQYYGEQALYGPSQEDKKYIPKSGGHPSYYSIVPIMDKMNYHYDSIAEAPYLVDTASNIFITYENERSLKAKAKYVMDNNAMGIFIWDITGDMMESSPQSGIINDTPLLYAIHDGFCIKDKVKLEKKLSRKSSKLRKE